MNEIITLIGASFTNPRMAAQTILSLPRDRDVAFSALGLSVVLSVLMTFSMSGGQPIKLTSEGLPLMPWTLTLLVMSITTIMAFMIHLTGQAMSGKGDLPGAIMVMAWMQALFLAGQVIQGFLILMSPGIGAVFGFALTLFILFVLLTFIDELHELGSLGRAAFLLFMAFVGVTLGLSFLLTLLGVSA